MIRAPRPHRLLLQLAFLATLLMVLAPLVSRALQPSPVDPAAMGHDMTAMAMTVAGHEHHHGAPATPAPPVDPHATHGEACEYCVLALRLLPWLAVVILLLPLRWQPTGAFCWSSPQLPLLYWPAHAARGPPPASIVR